MKRSTVLFTAAAIGTAAFVLPVGAQKEGSDHASHLAAYDAHASMTSGVAAQGSRLVVSRPDQHQRPYRGRRRRRSRHLAARSTPGACCGGVLEVGRSRPDVAGGVRPGGLDEHRRAGRRAVQPGHRLGRHRRVEHLPQLVLGRRRLQVHRQREDVAAHGPDRHAARSAASSSIRRIPNIVYVASAGHEWTENEMRGVFKTTDGGKSWTKVAVRSAAKTGVNDHRDGSERSRTRCTRRRGSGSGASGTTRASEPGFNESGIFKTTDARQELDAADERPAAVERPGRIGLAVARVESERRLRLRTTTTMRSRRRRRARRARPRPDPGGSAASVRSKATRSIDPNDKGATLDAGQRPDDEQRTFMKGMSDTYALGLRQHPRRSDRREHDLHARARRQRVARRRQDVRRDRPLRRPPAARRRRGRRPRGGGGRGLGGDNHAMWIDPKDPKFMLSRQRQRLPRRRPTAARRGAAPTCRRRRSSTSRTTWTRRSACTDRCRITAAIAASSMSAAAART